MTVMSVSGISAQDTELGMPIKYGGTGTYTAMKLVEMGRGLSLERRGFG